MCRQYGVELDVVGNVKLSVLRSFGHIGCMEGEMLKMKMNLSEVDVVGRPGRP